MSNIDNATIPSTDPGLPTLQIIVASTRPGRVGRSVGEWMERVAVEHGVFNVELVDLAEVALPFLDEPNHPRLGQYNHQHTKDWSASVSRGDAFVFVTPEYNHSFNAVLKNALDFLYGEWEHKAASFVSYGGVAAGTRAVQALKPVLAAVRMTAIVEAVNIPFVTQFLDDAGAFEPTAILTNGARSMLDELAAQTDAFRSRRSEPLVRGDHARLSSVSGISARSS